MSEDSSVSNGGSNVVKLAADIASAYVSFNTVSSSELPDLLRTIHSSLDSISHNGSPPSEEARPAVPVRRSIHDDYLVCLEDGKKLKMLKRYPRTRYNMSPETYRRKRG